MANEARPYQAAVLRRFSRRNQAVFDVVQRDLSPLCSLVPELGIQIDRLRAAAFQACYEIDRVKRGRGRCAVDVAILGTREPSVFILEIAKGHQAAKRRPGLQLIERLLAPQGWLLVPNCDRLARLDGVGAELERSYRVRSTKAGEESWLGRHLAHLSAAEVPIQRRLAASAGSYHLPYGVDLVASNERLRASKMSVRRRVEKLEEMRVRATNPRAWRMPHACRVTRSVVESLDRKSRVTAEAMQRELRALRRRKLHLLGLGRNGPLPFGWTRDRDGMPIVNESRWPVVEWVLNESKNGHSARLLARELRNAGHRISDRTVQRMISRHRAELLDLANEKRRWTGGRVSGRART